MAFGGFAPLPIRLGGTDEDGWSPEQHARMCVDLQAAKRTAPFAVLTYTKSGATITIHSYYGMNGVGLAHAPTATDGGTGITSFAWSSPRFEDPYEVGYGLKLRGGRATAHGSSYRKPTVLITAPAAFTVYTRDAAGTAQDCKVTVKVS